MRVVAVGATARFVDLRSSSAASTARPHSVVTGSDTNGSLVDLAIRWRHLESRVELAGIWTNLLGAWPFDEGTGYAFTDVSGHEFTLFITGSAWNTSESGLTGSVHRAGLRGSAVNLNGSRWLEAAPTSAIAPDDRGLSLTAWIKLNRLPAAAATIIGVGPNALLTLHPGGRAYWSVTTVGGVRYVIRTDVALPTRTWVQLGATVDPSTGTLALYVGGNPHGHLTTAPFSLPPPSDLSLVMGRGIDGLLDEVTLHRGVLPLDALQQIRLLGLPRTFTQTSESIDEARSVFTRFKGSEAIPHPNLASTVLGLRFFMNLVSDQDTSPVHEVDAVFVPTDFGCGWRAMSEAATYASPLIGAAGTFEAWYRPVDDPDDPRRLRRHVVFTAQAQSSEARLELSTFNGRWQLDVMTPSGGLATAVGPVQAFPPSTLAHIAVAWGTGTSGRAGVRLLIDGRWITYLQTAATDTTYDGTVSIGGTVAAPSYCIFEDVRLSDVIYGWGGVCPRGQASTAAAGIDLRDFFRRPPGTAPLWWRPGAGGIRWPIFRRLWQKPQEPGDDPDANLAVLQPFPTGLRTLYHPDAFARACSIEAGASVEQVADGWIGLFLHADDPELPFSGITFMLNTKRNMLRLCRYDRGEVKEQKSAIYDFSLQAKKVYELTLTAAGDGILRGFVDQINMISINRKSSWPTEGFAGLATDHAAASFSALHFTVITPATPTSREIQTSELKYGEHALNAGITLVPFRWNKRRGLFPWQYISRDPELPGNIAGADSTEPLRPIPPARWRSEESANSDLIVVDGVVWYLLRGNPRIDGGYLGARIGMLHTPASAFDGIHFIDPNQDTGRLSGGAILTANRDLGPRFDVDKPTNLNEPSSAYVGGKVLLFLGRESKRVDSLVATESEQRYLSETTYARFDLTTGEWVTRVVREVDWSEYPVNGKRLFGTPEMISRRDPVTNEYNVVLFQQISDAAHGYFMATAIVVDAAAGQPQLAADMPVNRVLQRPGGAEIYGFRVMFDNGIYYLHYNEGPDVPDWPQRFVLATALDPYTGPWVVNPQTMDDSSDYFRRGLPDDPDNGAIWAGTMFKFRGHYYMYYENYHAIGDDVDDPYRHYVALQEGSRVGFSTA